jgi:hypothetical protein
MTDRERHACTYAEAITELIEWHKRRAIVKRRNAAGEKRDSIAHVALIGNADTHDISVAALQRVLNGKAVE